MIIGRDLAWCVRRSERLLEVMQGIQGMLRSRKASSVTFTLGGKRY